MEIETKFYLNELPSCVIEVMSVDYPKDRLKVRYLTGETLFLISISGENLANNWTEIKKENEMESIQETLAERGKVYGDFKNHAKITQLLKGVILQEQGYSRLSNSQREALDMIFHKVGRIINGDPNYIDSWVDIVGYAQLEVDELKAKEEFDRIEDHSAKRFPRNAGKE